MHIVYASQGTIASVVHECQRVGGFTVTLLFSVAAGFDLELSLLALLPLYTHSVTATEPAPSDFTYSFRYVLRGPQLPPSLTYELYLSSDGTQSHPGNVLLRSTQETVTSPTSDATLTGILFCCFSFWQFIFVLDINSTRMFHFVVLIRQLIPFSEQVWVNFELMLPL